MKSKKGVVEVQFNWIFILIAGALILAFFISLVAKQKTTSDLSAKAKISVDLEAILTGAGSSRGTVNIIDIPKAEIEFYCGSYMIGGISRDAKEIIFAPSLIKGTKLIAWSLGWDVPYRVTNFLYLTSPEARYILVGTGDLFLEINKTIPDKINKEWYPTKPTDTFPLIVQSKNNYKVKFVLFDTIITSNVDISALSKMPDDDVTAIKINGDINSGEITFYKKQGGSWKGTGEGTSYYLGKESLIGAIFSEYKDIETEKVYDCIMKKAFKRLDIVSQIYASRSNEIKNTVTDTTCAGIHSSANIDLISISDISAALSQSFPNTLNDIVGKASNLKNLNDNAQSYSCPLIY